MNEKQYILWPEYFDRNLPRRLGRRVPLELAVPSPTIKELIKVCEELGLEYEHVSDKKYPRVWYRSGEGYLIVKLRDNIPKQRLVRLIAEKLALLRGHTE